MKKVKTPKRSFYLYIQADVSSGGTDAVPKASGSSEKEQPPLIRPEWIPKAYRELE